MPERGRNTVGNILIRMPDDTLAAVRRVDRTGEEDESEIETPQPLRLILMMRATCLIG